MIAFYNILTSHHYHSSSSCSSDSPKYPISAHKIHLHWSRFPAKMSKKFLAVISAVVGVLMVSSKTTASLIVTEDKEIQSLADGINEDSAAPPNLETAIKFEDELLLDGPIVKLSPEEVVIEVDKMLETIMGEDGAINKTEGFPPNQPPEEPGLAPKRPVVKQDEVLNPSSITNEDSQMPNERLSITDGPPFEVSDRSTQIPTEGPSYIQMESNQENETKLGLDKLTPETKIDPDSPMKKHLDSLSHLNEEPLRAVDDIPPVEILEIKYIRSDFEPYLMTFPEQHGRDIHSDDQVPPILIDMTPLSVPKPRGKSVKKDLGSKLPQTQLTPEQSEQKVNDNAPTVTTATSSPQSSNSEEFEEPETIHESLTMPLKIQEILPSMNASEPKGSTNIEAVGVSTRKSIAQAKPSPFYFLSGPFIIQGDTVRPYVGKKHDGAPSTYFLNVPGEDPDVPPFNEAQAQLIAEA